MTTHEQEHRPHKNRNCFAVNTGFLATHSVFIWGQWTIYVFLGSMDLITDELTYLNSVRKRKKDLFMFPKASHLILFLAKISRPHFFKTVHLQRVESAVSGQAIVGKGWYGWS
jgi:hypothetical protein